MTELQTFGRSQLINLYSPPLLLQSPYIQWWNFPHQGVGTHERVGNTFFLKDLRLSYTLHGADAPFQAYNLSVIKYDQPQTKFNYFDAFIASPNEFVHHGGLGLSMPDPTNPYIHVLYQRNIYPRLAAANFGNTFPLTNCFNTVDQVTIPIDEYIHIQHEYEVFDDDDNPYLRYDAQCCFAIIITPYENSTNPGYQQPYPMRFRFNCYMDYYDNEG